LSKKILIVYASGFGTTQEIAMDIGKVLTEIGLDVNVLSVNDVQDVSGYDGVVLGASIRAGNLLPQALEFARKNQEALKKVPFAAFVVCLTMQRETEENRRIVLCWTNPLRDIVEPFDIGLFAGRLILQQFPFPDPLLKELMAQSKSGSLDWDGMRSWAKGLVPVLGGAAQASISRRPGGC
jgi:menaquinone-dependent protoporphyrinogen oxidase